MAEYKPVTHCIFDMDGLLLDTEGIYLRVLSEQAAKYGKVYSDDVRTKVMGTVESDTVNILLRELDINVSYDEFLEGYKELQTLYLPEAKLMPGAEKLIRHLHKSRVPICVATSSGKGSVDIKTTNHKEIFGLFHHIVMGSSDPEVKNGKPHPDIFLLAAKRFDDCPTAEKCLVFEDSLNGVKAAIAADMQVVMVPDPIIPVSERKIATVVLNSLEDFKPELFGLPPY